MQLTVSRHLLTKIYSPVLSGPKESAHRRIPTQNILTWDEELDYDTIGDLKRHLEISWRIIELNQTNGESRSTAEPANGDIRRRRPEEAKHKDIASALGPIL